MPLYHVEQRAKNRQVQTVRHNSECTPPYVVSSASMIDLGRMSTLQNRMQSPLSASRRQLGRVHERQTWDELSGPTRREREAAAVAQQAWLDAKPFMDANRRAQARDRVKWRQELASNRSKKHAARPERYSISPRSVCRPSPPRWPSPEAPDRRHGPPASLNVDPEYNQLVHDGSSRLIHGGSPKRQEGRDGHEVPSLSVAATYAGVHRTIHPDKQRHQSGPRADETAPAAEEGRARPVTAAADQMRGRTPGRGEAGAAVGTEAERLETSTRDAAAASPSAFSGDGGRPTLEAVADDGVSPMSRRRHGASGTSDRSTAVAQDDGRPWPCSPEEVRQWAAAGARAQRGHEAVGRTFLAERLQQSVPPSACAGLLFCERSAAMSPETARRAAIAKAARLSEARAARAAAEEAVVLTVLRAGSVRGAWD